MSGERFPVPPLVLALDFVGVLLVVVGVLALTGTDFGYPVLARAAPGLIVIGVLLMAPLVVWAVRKGLEGKGVRSKE